jgi:hypothetical protein
MFLRAWTLLAIFVLLSSMLAWSAIAAKPVLALDADHLAFTVQPVDVQTTDTIDVTVEVQDATNAAVTDYADSIHIDLLHPGSSSLSGTVDITPTDGDAQFQLAIEQVGSGFQLEASSGILNAVDSDTFKVTPGVPAKLAFVDQPTDFSADNTFNTSVELLDAHGNRATQSSDGVSLELLNPGQLTPTLYGTASVSAGAGLASFSGLGIHKADINYTLKATSGTLTTDESDAFEVTHGVATHLNKEEDVESSYSAASDISMEIAVADQYENVVDGWPNDVSLTLHGGDPAGVIEEADTSFEATGGVAHPEVHIRKPGTAYYFDIASTGLPTIQSGTFDVGPGPIDHFVFDPIDDQVAGTPFDVTVTAYDHWNNIKTDYDGEEAELSGLSDSPGCSTCGTTIPVAEPDYGTLSWEDGVGKTSVTAKAAETNTKLTITDPSATSDSATFDVDNADSLGGFDIDSVGDQKAGTGFTAKVTAYDPYGNVYDTYDDASAHLTGLDDSPGCSTCGTTILPTGATYGGPLSWSGGKASTQVTPYKAQSSAGLTITDGTTSDTSTFDVDDAGTLAAFDLAAIGSQVAGTGFVATVTAYDPYGNVYDAFDGTGASFSGLNASPGCPICGTPLTSVSADYGELQWSNGVGTSKPSKKVVPYKAESASLRFGTLTIADTSSFTVTYKNALGGLSIADITGTKTANVAFAVSVTAYDEYGNVKKNHASVTLDNLALSPGCTASDCGSAISMTLRTPTYGTPVWTNGVMTTNVTAKNSQANASVRASDSGKSDTSTTFTVNPSTATRLLFSDSAVGFNGRPIDTKLSQPIYSTCTPPGSGLNPCGVPPASAGTKVLAIDQFGNRVGGVSGVAITKTAGSGTLTNGGARSTATGTPGVAPYGEASFDTMTINALGSATLRAASGSLTVATTSLRILDDLEACDGHNCDNLANTNANVRSYALINTDGDFFDTSQQTNVILDTAIAPVGDFASKCTGASPFTSGPDIRVVGSGINTTAPMTTMVIIVPKDVLKAKGITARNASSFNVCLGALWIDSQNTPTPWTVKGGGSAQTRGTGDPLRYWGTPADCIPNVVATSPCIDLRTKQAADVANYLHMTAAQVATFMKDSDVAVIVKKPWPWDGKGGLY